MSERLDEIRARLNAATPGPWWVYRKHLTERGEDGQPVERLNRWIQAGQTMGRCVAHMNGECLMVPNPGDNADFIAHAPEDIAYLLERVARAERVVVAAQKVMAKLEKYGPSIVPHLLDTDENDGEELRQALADWVGRGTGEGT